MRMRARGCSIANSLCLAPLSKMTPLVLKIKGRAVPLPPAFIWPNVQKMVSFTVNAVCVLFELLFHQQQNLTLFHEVRRVSLANAYLWGWLWLVVYSVWKLGRAPTTGGKLLLFKHTEEHTWWWSLPFPSSNKTVHTNGACNSLQSIK